MAYNSNLTWTHSGLNQIEQQILIPMFYEDPIELFFSEKFECFHCHGEFNFTQSSQHENQRLDLRPFDNTGLYNIDERGAYPVANPYKSPFLAGFALQLQQKQDLIEFLQSLTDLQFLNSNVNLPDCLKTKECKGKRTLVSS